MPSNLSSHLEVYFPPTLGCNPFCRPHLRGRVPSLLRRREEKHTNIGAFFSYYKHLFCLFPTKKNADAKKEKADVEAREWKADISTRAALQHIECLCISISYTTESGRTYLTYLWFISIKIVSCTNSNKAGGISKAEIARASGDVQSPADIPSKPEGLDLKETMRWQHIDESLSRGDITSILRTKEQPKLDELVGMNQGLLQCIGTSHVSIEVCQITAAFKLQ